MMDRAREGVWFRRAWLVPARCQWAARATAAERSRTGEALRERVEGVPPVPGAPVARTAGAEEPPATRRAGAAGPRVGLIVRVRSHPPHAKSCRAAIRSPSVL